MQRQIWRHNPHYVNHPIQPVSSQLPLKVELEIVRGRAKQLHRPVLTSTFLIGMAEDCDLVLGDPQFPEVHAYVRITDSVVTLRHLGFAPAITVNGEPATQINLVDGDRIRTGPYEFLVHLLQPTAEDDDQGDSLKSLRLPAAIDRVEDEVGNALVQKLLAEIRHDLLPSARLKLFVDPDSVLGTDCPDTVANSKANSKTGSSTRLCS